MKEEVIKLYIEGDPEAKERPRKGYGDVFYTPKKTKDYENYAAILYGIQYAKTYFLNVPLEISVYAGFKRPKKPKYSVPLKKDLDNIIKILKDAMNKAAYGDDAWVCRIKDSAKFYCDKPGVLLIIKAIKKVENLCPEKHKKLFFDL